MFQIHLEKILNQVFITREEALKKYNYERLKIYIEPSEIDKARDIQFEVVTVYLREFVKAENSCFKYSLSPFDKSVSDEDIEIVNDFMAQQSEKNTKTFPPLHIRTKEQHIEAVRYRAYQYLESGDRVNAISSIISDLKKHPETAKFVSNNTFIYLHTVPERDIKSFLEYLTI